MREWQRTYYYVNEALRLKTWKRPDTQDYPSMFRKRASGADEMDTFESHIPPPLPPGFATLSPDQDGDNEEEFPVEGIDYDFEYPLKVYLLCSPIRPVRHVYDFFINLWASAKRVNFENVWKRVFGCSWKFVVLEILLGLNHLAWLVTCVVLSLVAFWPELTSMGLYPLVSLAVRKPIKVVLRIPAQIKNEILTAMASGLTLKTIWQLGQDSSSWSHWKVLVSELSCWDEPISSLCTDTTT